MPDASPTDRTDGELDWPAWLDRTEPRRRERTRKFEVSLGGAISGIETTLEDRLDVDDWRLSTAAPHRKSDGRPYANANPDDPGAVVRWSDDGDQYAVAADHYTDLRSNVRAIGLYLEEKRKMANRPVETGQSEFATAQLPSGDEDDAIEIGPNGAGGLDEAAAAELLGVREDADEDAIRGAAERKLRVEHPDHGGDGDVATIKAARDRLLEDDDA